MYWVWRSMKKVGFGRMRWDHGAVMSSILLKKVITTAGQSSQMGVTIQARIFLTMRRVLSLRRPKLVGRQ